ncbi:MAG: hypothetical protein V3S24_17200, partial [Candidatus Tectomicrobia bacterium]
TENSSDFFALPPFGEGLQTPTLRAVTHRPTSSVKGQFVYDTSPYNHEISPPPQTLSRDVETLFFFASEGPNPGQRREVLTAATQTRR